VSPVDTDVVLFLNIELKIRKDHLFVMKIYDYFVYTVYKGQISGTWELLLCGY
jgi:hypothetical protein